MLFSIFCSILSFFFIRIHRDWNLIWHMLHRYRADLANLVNEAALLAGRQSKVVVEKFDFIQAVERSIAVSHTHSLWYVFDSN